MNRIKKTLLQAGLVAALGASVPFAASAQQLNFASFVGAAHTINSSVIVPLSQGLSGDSNGQLSIVPRHGGELASGPATFAAVALGTADLGWALPAYTSTQFPRTLLAELPGIIPDGKSGYELLWNAWDAGLLAGEFQGTRPLALWVSEPAIFIMRDRDVRTPADLAGLRIRSGGAIQANLIRALGATPVDMPAPEMYNALQQGNIDGIITGSSAILDFRLDEVAHSYTLGASLGQIAFFVVLNEDRYQFLTPANREILDRHSGRVLSASAENGWNTTAAQIISNLRANPQKRVIDLSEEQAAAFSVITDRVREDEVARVNGGQQVVDAMLGDAE